MNAGRTITVLLTALMLSSGQAWSQSRSASESDDSRLIDAVAQMNEGRIGSAVQTLGSIIASDPDNDAAHYYLGLCCIYADDIKNAQDALKKACSLDPSNYWYRDRLAIAYSAAGEDDLTIATYEELLKEFPKKTDIWFTLVNLYLNQNNFNKALEAMDQIETIFGRSENVTSTKYDILLRQNKPDEALKALEDYNKEFSSPYVLAKLGDHSMAEGNDSTALGYYKEALDLQSGYVPALLGESEVYRTRRNYPEFFSTLGRFISSDDAEAGPKAQYLNMLLQRSDPRFLQNNRARIDTLFDILVLTSPKDSSALINAGMYYYATERTDKARDLFYRNMKTYPKSISAAATYTQMLSYIQDWEALDAACDSALTVFPAETAFLDLKNYSAYNKEDWQSIIDNSRRIIEIARGDTSITIPALANIGDMYHELGNEKEAFRTYKQVLKQNPDYAPTLNNYAYFLSLKGRSLKKACAMSRKTIEKEPNNATYLDTYGWILHLLGKNQEAKTVFKHAMLYGAKDSATSLDHYAEVLDSLGETDLAKVYRTQAANRRAEGKK